MRVFWFKLILQGKGGVCDRGESVFKPMLNVFFQTLLRINPVLPKMIKNRNVIRNYTSDESNIFRADETDVQGIYFPESIDDIVSVIKDCRRDRVFCTISGAGTGITGARTPLFGGIVLAMEKMLSIENDKNAELIEEKTSEGVLKAQLNQCRKTLTVAPGVSLDNISRLLPAEFFYPPDPTEWSASAGGTAATNASGAHSFYYGPTREWIQSMTVVLPDGELLSLERGKIFADNERRFSLASDSGKKYSFTLPSYDSPKIKNAAGLYVRPNMDLIDLFIGSEGIFGVTAELTLVLADTPKNVLQGVNFFDEESKSLDFIDKMRSAKNKGISAIEFFDENALSLLQQKYSLIDPVWKAGVFIEMIYTDDEKLEWLMETAQKNGSAADWYAQNQQQFRELKEFRHTLPDEINSMIRKKNSKKLGTDFVVPPEKFPEMFAAYKKAGEEFKRNFPRQGFHYLIFGHIGDYHLHCNFITESQKERDFVDKLYVKLAQKAVAFKGSISGEHGVGKKTIVINGNSVPYLQLMYGKKALKEISAVKKEFDPDFLLNPGNVIGLSSTLKNKFVDSR